MQLLKGIERFLFGVDCLLWGVFALAILDSGAGDCHCFDFSKDECVWEMSVYGLTAAWLVADGIIGRGILGRWGKWTCAVFWGIAALAQWICSRQIGWPEHYQTSTLLVTYTLALAFFASLSYCLVCMVHGGLERHARVALAHPDGWMAMAWRDGGLCEREIHICLGKSWGQALESWGQNLGDRPRKP